MKSKRTKIQTDKVYDTRREAFRAAKRDNDIPVTQQPEKVVKPFTEEGRRYQLDQRNRRLYIFSFLASLFGISSEREVHIREDKEAFYKEEKGSQMDHFNSGEVKESSKLRKHHYFRRK